MGSCVSTQIVVNASPKLQSNPAEATRRPMSRLPDEVLYSIFISAAHMEPIRSLHDQPPSEFEHESYHRRLGWTRLCGVDRRWRVLLISFAPLWASIVFHLPPGPAVLALSRAKEAPLNMRVPITAVPSRKGRLATLKRRLTRVKGEERPSDNRERLLALAITHAHRMRQFFAEDLTVQNFQDIFRLGLFDNLRVLVLKHHQDWRELSGESLGQLHIHAPRVEQAHLHIALPIARDDGLGLQFVLPALLDLELSVSRASFTRPKGIDRLQWLAPLIRGAPKLRSLVSELSSDIPVDWSKVFGDEAAHREALRVIRLSGTADTHQDEFFLRVVTSVPPHISFTEKDQLLGHDGVQLVGRYGEIIARSMCLHPMDSMIISRGPYSSFDIFDLCAYSQHELPGPYLMIANYIYNACISLFYSAALSARMDLGCAGDALTHLSHILPQNAIKHLVLDEHVTDSWVQSSHEFLHSCLAGVTTVHCTYFYNPIACDANSEITPCTTLLRRILQRCSKPLDSHSQLLERHLSTARAPESSSVDGHQHVGDVARCSDLCLPLLETLVVSMGVPMPPKGKKKREHPSTHPAVDAVRAWWDEVLQVLSYRRDVGLRLRMLQIVGGWASKEMHRATAEIDARMFAQAAEMVDDIVDERTVWLRFTYDSSQDYTQTFSSSGRAFMIPSDDAW